jgi:hypothetical protein
MRTPRMFELLLFGVDVQRNDTIILLFVPSICSPFFSARIPKKMSARGAYDSVDSSS